jgi:hypothetical protein
VLVSHLSSDLPSKKTPGFVPLKVKESVLEENIQEYRKPMIYTDFSDMSLFENRAVVIKESQHVHNEFSKSPIPYKKFAATSAEPKKFSILLRNIYGS